MLSIQQPQLERLKTMAQVNPSIRPEEIDQQRQLIEQLQQAIEHSALKLDAIQVLIST
jgi:hypothetical protein